MKKHIPQLDVHLSQNLVEPETERILGILDKYLDENYGDDVMLFENARDFQGHLNKISQIIQYNEPPAAESTSSDEDGGESPTPSEVDESETPSTLPNIAADAQLSAVASTSANHSSSTAGSMLGKKRGRGRKNIGKEAQEAPPAKKTNAERKSKKISSTTAPERRSTHANETLPPTQSTKESNPFLADDKSSSSDEESSGSVSDRENRDQNIVSD